VHTSTINAYIHEFSPNVAPGYKISGNTDADYLLADHRTEHFGSNDVSVRHNAIFTKPTFGSKFQSFNCTKKKRLNASNIAFLQFLGFAVRNI